MAVTARTASELDETVTQIEQSGGRALAVPADVTERQAVAAIVDTVTARFGPVDLLINNAGTVTPLGPLWKIDPDEWWRSMEINLRSVLLCSSAVLLGMVARQRGRIINIASAAGKAATAHVAAYVTAKTAMVRLTENLAAETKEHGTVRTSPCAPRGTSPVVGATRVEIETPVFDSGLSVYNIHYGWQAPTTIGRE